MKNDLQVKNFKDADEVRTLPKTKIEVVNFNDNTLMKVTFQPGWKWSDCVKPTVNTDSCQAPHIMHIYSGRMMVVMDNGKSQELGPNDVAIVPPGHDAWVLGDEECIAIDFSAGKTYGKK